MSDKARVKDVVKPESLKIGYYSSKDLKKKGMKVGKNVFISKAINIVGIKNILIKDNVRIDSYCNIIANQGYLKIGSYVHISSNNFLACYKGIEFSNFSTTSPGVKIFSLTSDFKGNYLTNPIVSAKANKVYSGKVVIKEHSIIGANSIIMPGVVIKKGVAVGSNSLIKKKTQEWSIYAGTPAKRIGKRSKKMLQFEKNLLSI